MNKIRELRIDRGLSQARLAARAELDPSTVNQIERGARDASPLTLRKIAQALGVSLAELIEETDSPKAARRSSPEPTLLNGLDDERRESKLPEVADLLLTFGQHLLRTWEMELPSRVQADDDAWLKDIRIMWREFGLINYRVLEELGAGRLRDKQDWLARYMDLNTAVHRINSMIQEHSTAKATRDEVTAMTLEPMAMA